MEVYALNDNRPEQRVVIAEDDGEKDTPCQWSFFCPSETVCGDCKAKGIDDQLTHSEAIEWWKNQ